MVLAPPREVAAAWTGCGLLNFVPGLAAGQLVGAMAQPPGDIPVAAIEQFTAVAGP
jgi:hypothetical protein